MKISEKLPQFENKKTVFLVLGRQEAMFYLAYKGKFELLEEINIPKPTHADKAGRFQVTGKKGPYHPVTMNNENINKTKTKEGLLKEIKQKIPTLVKKHDPDKLHIFAPDYIISEAKEVLPKYVQKKVYFEFKANYIKKHPFEILRKIHSEHEKEKKENKNKMIDPEARKILKKKK